MSKPQSYEEWVVQRISRTKGRTLHTKALTKLPQYLDELEGHPALPALERRLGAMRETHHLATNDRHWYIVERPTLSEARKKPKLAKVHPKQLPLFGAEQPK